MSEELHPLFRFRPVPWPGPDPASLLQFVVESEQPAVRQQILSAYLEMSVEHLQSQVKYLGAVQKSLAKSR